MTNRTSDWKAFVWNQCVANDFVVVREVRFAEIPKAAFKFLLLQICGNNSWIEQENEKA